MENISLNKMIEFRFHYEDVVIKKQKIILFGPYSNEKDEDSVHKQKMITNAKKFDTNKGEKI